MSYNSVRRTRFGDYPVETTLRDGGVARGPGIGAGFTHVFEPGRAASGAARAVIIYNDLPPA
eukprot:SAG31_NODE_11084_length_1068_cov_0.848297_1_plen_61_part_10